MFFFFYINVMETDIWYNILSREMLYDITIEVFGRERVNCPVVLPLNIL